MTERELLERVKEGINVYGDTLDGTLTIYITEIKEFMKDAGVPETFFNEIASVGIVTKGVRDLYFDGSLSDYFYKRLYQLKLEVANV
jgi:hypothetical protein